VQLSRYKISIKNGEQSYVLNIFKEKKVDGVEIICIGNIVAGGTGKTPAVQYFVQKYLEKNNIHQFLNINQGEYAKNVDLELEDIQYIVFGNPKVGTLLMQDDLYLSFNLPLKLLLIKREDKTEVLYEKPTSWLKEEHSDRIKDILPKMDNLFLDIIKHLEA